MASAALEVDAQQFAGADMPDAQQAGGLADIGVAAQSSGPDGEGLVLIQALSGEEVALGGADVSQAELFSFAKQMSNFQYVVGDRRTGGVSGCGRQSDGANGRRD